MHFGMQHLCHCSASNAEVSAEIPCASYLHLITSCHHQWRCSSRAGYHGWDLQFGATSTIDTFSSLTFLMHLQLTYWAFSHDVNKSIENAVGTLSGVTDILLMTGLSWTPCPLYSCLPLANILLTGRHSSPAPHFLMVGE